LLGNIGDKVTIEVDFRAEEIFVTANEEDIDRIILAPDANLINTPNNSDVVFCEQTDVFQNYRVGDKIQWYSTNAPTPALGTELTIYEKINNQAIRVYENTIGDKSFAQFIFDVDSYIYITTDLTAINYRWNMVENISGDTFIEKIAAELNQAKAGGIDNNNTTLFPMVFDVPVTNNYGTIQVKGNGEITKNGGVIAQRFTVVHDTIITPFFLAGQQTDLENGVKPSYLKANKSLKYITSIDVGRTSNDPNFIQTVGFSALDGNVGWYDENFNGNASKFSIDSVTYKNQALETISSIELTENSQTVEIIVKSADGVFSDTNTDFDLTFFILPDETNAYRNNGKNIIENFYLDKAFDTIGTAFTTGDNVGTDYQVIAGALGTFVDVNTFKITATIDLTAAGVADLSAKGFEYFIGVSTQDHTKGTEDSDRVHLKADIQPFYVDLSDDGMIVFEEVKILRHYESDFDTEGTASPIIRTEDDVLTYCKFYIDRAGRETDNISISSILSQVVAKKSDGSEFVLDEFNQSLSGALVVNGTQYIDASSQRSFQMPDGDIRKTIAVKRRVDLDTTDLRYYEVKYPFLMRWEYWTSKAGVDGDAFDVNEPNNGQNENWHRYDTLTDWDIYFRTRVSATKNGEAQVYQNDLLLETYDYLEDTEWINETIETFDADTGDPLNGLIKSPCKVVISKEYSGLDVPLSADNVEWVMRVEVFEQGGVNDIRFLSSVYDWTERSWFKSVDGSNKVKKTKVGNVFTAEALIDFNKIPELQQFSISGRIYDENALAPVSFCLLQEDGDKILVEDNSGCIQVEN
jgi:hypothetical protein